MTRFEDVIERDGRLVYTNVGDSMRPLIRQDRDLLIIEKYEGRLKSLPKRKRPQEESQRQRQQVKHRQKRLAVEKRKAIVPKARENRRCQYYRI